MIDGSSFKRLAVWCLQDMPGDRPTIDVVTQNLQCIKADTMEQAIYANSSILDLLTYLSEQERIISDCQHQVIEKQQQIAELQTQHKKEYDVFRAEFDDKTKQLDELRSDTKTTLVSATSTAIKRVKGGFVKNHTDKTRQTASKDENNPAMKIKEVHVKGHSLIKMLYTGCVNFVSSMPYFLHYLCGIFLIWIFGGFLTLLSHLIVHMATVLGLNENEHLIFVNIFLLFLSLMVLIMYMERRLTNSAMAKYVQ